MKIPYAIGCPRCREWMEVSEVDADATLSEMREHLFVRHAGYRHDAVGPLLAKVTELTRNQAARR